MQEEAKIGGNYLVDIEIKTDFSSAMFNDKLSDTVDYVRVNQIVKSEMEIRSKLIEHVGQRILSKLQSEISKTAEYLVRIKKIAPPINGDVEFVSITVQSENF